MWIQIHSESGFGFTDKSNGLDSWVLSEVTSLLFVYVCDVDVTSGFASKSMSKLHSLDSRIQIRALNGRIYRIRIRIQIRQIEYGLNGLQQLYTNIFNAQQQIFTTAIRHMQGNG